MQFDKTDEFWTSSYRGHSIATLSQGSGWLVYLDHVLQHDKLFATADAAVNWLHQQVDGSPEHSRPGSRPAQSAKHLLEC